MAPTSPSGKTQMTRTDFQLNAIRQARDPVAPISATAVFQRLIALAKDAPTTEEVSRRLPPINKQ